jgi:glucose-1-phosphate adenylyltransferase
VFVQDGALVEDSVLMDSVVVEPGAVVQRAILDKNVRVGAGVRVDAEDAAGRGFTVSARGVVAVAKGQVVDAR